MPKPGLDTVAKKPARPKPRKLAPERTVVTRAANANKNPMDLEVSSTEEEAPPTRKRKKTKKTQEELDTAERQRDAVLAAVCKLEDDMARREKVHDGTPHRSSISRDSSYIAPDPPPPHARSKSRPSVILSTTEDDNEVQPPAKKSKSAARAQGDSEEGQTQVRKPKSAAKDKGKGKKAATIKRVPKATRDEDLDVKMDVDSDEEALPPKKKKKKKKAKLVRAAIDQHKADGLTNGMRAMMSSDAICLDSEDESPAIPKVTIRAPINDIFRGRATVSVKREKTVAQEEPETDSDIEIVAVNLKQKPLVIPEPKRKVKPIKTAKPDRDSYRQADSEEEQSALITDWSSRIVHRKPVGGASKATTPTLTSGTSKRSKASNAPSSSRTAVNNKVKIRNSDNYDNNVDDDVDGDGGLVSERDERYGGERALAANSPHKGRGNRITSSSLVRVKESRSEQHLAVPSKPSNDKKPTSRLATTVVTIKSEALDVKPSVSDKKTSKKVTNADLPLRYIDNGAWRVLIITLIRYIATTYDVFNVKDSTMIHALTILSTVIYGDAGIDIAVITTSSAPFRLATQRLSDSWRTIIGSAAIAALTAFFDSDPKWNSDARRKKFAIRLYNKQRYLYQHAEGETKKHFKGLFRGAFVIQTFAAHLNIISGSQEVLELYADDGITQTDQIPKARGAVALCAAAVMRAVALYATDGATLCSLKDVKGNVNNRLTFPAMILPISDTEIRDHTKRSSSFSALSWDGPTSYMAKACKGLSDENMASIIKEAKAFSRASRREAREIGSDFDPDNSLLQLGDESGSSSDEDMPLVRGAGCSNPVSSQVTADKDAINDSEPEMDEADDLEETSY